MRWVRLRRAVARARQLSSFGLLCALYCAGCDGRLTGASERDAGRPSGLANPNGGAGSDASVPNDPGTPSDSDSDGDGTPDNPDVNSGGGFTQPATPYATLRKLKNVLTGLPPTDAELNASADPEALRGLIDGWMQTPEFEQKMMLFFANSFQQSSLSQLDFEFQLRKRPGALDLPYGTFGDDAFPKLFQNMKESFARTCLQLIAEGRPFNEVLTTQRFMMTTALQSLYLQIEMPYDIHTMTFKVVQGFDTVRPSSMQSEIDSLTFHYAKPSTVTRKRNFGDQTANCKDKTSEFPGNTNLFQVLLGVVPRDAPCMEHAIKPYFSAADLSDWHMVTISDQGTPLRSYDLPAIRASGAHLSSKLPRVSFFTTPAFLAVWNTNDSNQHRVTTNQALLAALGQGYTSAQQFFPTPPSSEGLDGAHAVDGSACYGCHKSLDPMRQFFGNAFDFNDKLNTKSSSGGGSFAFGNVVADGSSLVDFGRFIGMVTDGQVDATPVNRFALALTQKLCFFANSSRCEETDPEMRRIALAFQDADYDFKLLVRELFSSPLVTASQATLTFDKDGVRVSILRRDQLCQALSNRLGKPDLCDIALPTPTNATSAINRLAGSIPADAFSRGAEYPVTPSDPNLFYRAASELVCEAVANQVVDAAKDSVYSSADGQKAIADMVVRVMGVTTSDANYARVLEILQQHYDTVRATKVSATQAMRSTFSAACQSPTALALGI